MKNTKEITTEEQTQRIICSIIIKTINLILITWRKNMWLHNDHILSKMKENGDKN